MQRINLSEKLKHNLKSILNEFDDYNDFTQSIESYEYAELLNTQATYCPYCNINSIKTIRRDENDKGERMDFDHFIRYSDSEELRLNCENLVPSCSTCNRKYKLRQGKYNEIIHPFQDDFNSAISFSLDINPQSVEDYKKAGIIYNIITQDKTLAHKAENSIELFNIINRYNDPTEKDKLDEFYGFIKYYPETRKKDINNLMPLERDIRNYYDNLGTKEINHTQFGKLKKDIINRYCNK